MDCIVRITFALLALFGSRTAGKLIERPRDTEVTVNHSTYFNCSTDIGPTAIFWFHGTKYVYTGEVILDPYPDRFEIDRFDGNGTYTYNLVIHSVQPEDAGKYTCAEDEGNGEQYSIQLIVFEHDPICRSNKELDKVIGQNTCNIEPDKVEIECSAVYHGNIPPQMEWKKVGENSSTSLEVSITTSRNEFVSTLKFTGEISLDNASYVCEAKRSIQGPIKCTSQVIRIMYAQNDDSTVNGTIDDEIHCNANTSQSCSYNWKWLQDNDYTIESTSSVLKARKLGWHRCEADCSLNNITCVLLVKRAKIYDESKSRLSATRIIIISVGVALLVALLPFLGVFCWRRIKKRQKLAGQRSADYVKPTPLISSGLAESSPLPYVPDIFGIAVLGQEVFILRQKGHSVEVYDSSTFNFKRYIKVHGMTNPENIASCSINNCLYAFDWEYLSILKINPTCGNLILTWNVDGREPGRGGRLSVANDTNVILNINYEAKLKEYNADGTPIREIKLDTGTDIFRAWHAVKLPSGLFLISHGGEGDPLYRTCMVSTKEITSTPTRIDAVGILRIYDGDGFLAVDKKGSIMVGGVLLSSNLDKPQVIVSKEHGLEKSWRSCYDESTGQWFVADYHRVLVCRVQDKVKRVLYNLDGHYMRFVLD